MAITIELQPQELQPVYNEIITVLSSTNSSKERFQYIIEININGTAQSKIKVAPDPSGFGVVDLHKHIEPYVTYDYTNTLTDLTEVQKATNSFTVYDITLSEEYLPTKAIVDIVDNGGGTIQITSNSHGYSAGNIIKVAGSSVSAYDGTYTIISVATNTMAVSGTYTGVDGIGGTVRLNTEPLQEFPSATVFAGTKWAWNGVLNWLDVPNWNKDDYSLLDGGYAKLLTSLDNYTHTAIPGDLTDLSNVYEVTSQSRMYLNFFDSNESFIAINIMAFDETGTYINDKDSNIAAGTDLEFLRGAVGPWNINNSGSGSGWGSNLLATATYYTVMVQQDEQSAFYTFKIVDECTKYETFQFLFMDRLGSFIPVTFNLLSRTSVNVTKTSYNKNHGSYNSTTNTWGYNSYDRGKTRLDTQVKEVTTVNSDWVTESKSAIIDEMIKSPEVYHIDEDGNSYAIDIITSNFTKKKRINDVIFNYTFDFEYSFMDAQQK